MNTNRRIAAIVGALFIIGTAAGILSVATAGPLLDDPDYLVEISANEDLFTVGACFVLVMGFSLALVPLFMFPIFKQHNETLALGYVVFRGALETVTYIAVVIVWLLLLSLSQEYTAKAAPDVSYVQNTGTLLLDAADWIGALLAIVFGLGALMLYYLFFQTELIPRWLSVWGLIAIILHLASAILVIFAAIEPNSTPQTILAIPIALQEMVMALWLIFKGFNTSSFASQPV